MVRIEGDPVPGARRVVVKGTFDGTHALRVETTPTGSRFVQREEFTGILLPLLWRTLNTKTRAGFEAMNEALKERVMAARTV